AHRGFGGSSLRSDVRCRDEQMAGRFFDDSVFTATWRLKNNSQAKADLVPGFAIGRYRQIPRELCPLSPDLVLVQPSSPGRPIITAIWTLLQAPFADSVFLRAVEQLDAALTNMAHPVRGVILVPILEASPTQSSVFRRLTIVHLPLPLLRAAE